MKVAELIRKLNLNVKSKGADKDISGCYTGDILSLAMAKVKCGNIWVTVQTNINTVAIAMLTDAACIILPENLAPDEDTKLKAESEKIYILSSEKTAYELCCDISKLLD